MKTREGFTGVMDASRDRVYGYAVHMLGDADEAADVTQDVFLRLWRRRNDVQVDRVLPWLLSVTRNACIDQLRHRQTVSGLVDRMDEGMQFGDDGASLPDADMERADVRDRIQRALRELPEPYRSIVILREIQEMSYSEICGALGLPMTTVKVYLHRGRKMLREELGGGRGEERGKRREERGQREEERGPKRIESGVDDCER